MKEKAIISKEKCIGCGLCVSDCPSRVIKIENKKAVVQSETCLMCGHCIAICPKEAVEISGLDMNEVIAYDKLSKAIESDQFLDYIKALRTVRKFKDQAIQDDVIQGIIEAGRFTATGTNRQKVRYIVVEKDIDLVEEMVLSMLKKLQKIMKYLGKILKSNYDLSRYQFERGFLFKNAPRLIMVVSEYELDAGLAARSMEIMSRTYDLAGLHVGIFTTLANKSKKIKKALGLKGKEKFVACLALGYPDVKYYRTVPREKAQIEWR